jgi:hypothetical protein
MKITRRQNKNMNVENPFAKILSFAKFYEALQIIYCAPKTILNTMASRN